MPAHNSSFIVLIAIFLSLIIIIFLLCVFIFRQRNKFLQEIYDLKKQVEEHRLQTQQQIQQALNDQQQRANQIEADASIESFHKHLDVFIETHLKEGIITAEMVCREMNLSETPLRNKMREFTGLSLNAYILAFRMDKARVLIETTDLSMAEVALECGYNSFSYFSQAFKRYFKTLPSQYSRKVGIKQEDTISSNN